MLRLWLCGRFAGEFDGVAVSMPASDRARALIGWLALHPGTARCGSTRWTPRRGSRRSAWSSPPVSWPGLSMNEPRWPPPPTRGDRYAEFVLTARSQAPVEEVWKLLHDPARFPEWWAGIETVRPDGRDHFTLWPAW